MWLFLYAIQLLHYIDFVPFFLFTMCTRNECRWGSVEEVNCISKSRNNQEALFLCPLLHQGDFVCVLLYYRPEQEVVREPLDVHHELELLMGATLELWWLQCLWPLSECFFYYCSKVSLQWFSRIVGESLAWVFLWRWGPEIDHCPVWYRQGVLLFPFLLVLILVVWFI